MLRPALAGRLNALREYLEVLRQTSMSEGLALNRALPVVHISNEARERWAMDRYGANRSLDRLAKAGLIEIVERKRGAFTKVRLVAVEDPGTT
jgi:DNA-binding MarR family transcriptional regulator